MPFSPYICRRIVAAVVGAVTGIVVVIVVGCGDGTGTPRPADGRGIVVDVSGLRCTRPATQGAAVIPADGSVGAFDAGTAAQDMTGEVCERAVDAATRRGRRADLVAAWNVHRTVTVALAAGGTYAADVPPDRAVAVGSAYP